METPKTKYMTKPTEEQFVEDCSDNETDDAPSEDDSSVVTDHEDKESGTDDDEPENTDVDDTLPVDKYSNNFYLSIQLGAICMICTYIGFVTGVCIARM